MFGTFKLESSYSPTGDQPEAIRALVDGIRSGEKGQTLLGVTGSGKTFTIANVVAQINRPTLVLSHNKTLAAQLYSEFKRFFPNNAVEYYVSYYDYYQPEAYIVSTDTYIEKDLQINEEIDRLRLRATSALLSGRSDVIVVASVSCIYGMGNPGAFYENVIEIAVGTTISRNDLMRRLVASQYVRNDLVLEPGRFRVVGDTVDIALSYGTDIVRVVFWGDEIDDIAELDAETGIARVHFTSYKIYPANLFLTTPETVERAIRSIKEDLKIEEERFRERGRILEADRLHERVNYDMEMIRELGHCSGIENYSRYFDGRDAGTRPYCLLDFFPKDFLMVIDESHVSVPQIHAMYGGDYSRKKELVGYGFRLSAAFDNRPLRFDEFESMLNQTIYVSATPADYELTQSGGVVVEQVIRPTGLLDPAITVRPSNTQVDDLMEEIQLCIENNERTLVTTLTKAMAEDLSSYLIGHGVKACYIHSDVDTLDRVRIIEDLRRGNYDVLVGVNLLREGLDIPEVALVAILDADKEGFLRNRRSLIQTSGRAARNVNGRVIMYAERISQAMQETIDETNRRRAKQMAYNKAHNITPRSTYKAVSDNSDLRAATPKTDYTAMMSTELSGPMIAAESQTAYGCSASAPASGETVESLRAKMEAAARGFDFVLAAHYRDEMLRLQREQDGKTED